MTATNPDAFGRLEGPAPVAAIARDLVRRGLIVAPVLIGLGAVGWQTEGAWSVAYGLALILINFAIAAYVLSAASRISFALMGAAALFGYLFRLAFIFAAVWLVKDESRVRLVPLGLTIIVSHLGLVFWEMRYVSSSLAHPGLKPTSPSIRHTANPHANRNPSEGATPS